jgi:nucleoporin NDC1
MLDSISSDSEFSKAAEVVAGEMEEQVSQMRIPELFRSVAPPSAELP